MNYFIDSHYHLEFIEDKVCQKEFLSLIKKEGIGIFAQSILPSSFVHFDEYPFLFLGLGFHPWWIENREQVERELEFFHTYLPSTFFIGEIGLDFSPKRLEKASKELQIETFSSILDQLNRSKEERYILSIHAVRSTSQVLDLLEEKDQGKFLPIFHRFSGTSQELDRLIKNEAYLSIHPTIFSSKKGRAYVKQVPQDRILLESDLPLLEKERTAEEYILALQEALQYSLNKLERIREEEIKVSILSNQSKIFGYFSNVKKKE